MASTETVVSQTKFLIEFNGAIKVDNGCIAIVCGYRAKDKPGKSIAAPQVFFVSFGIDSCRLRQSRLLVRTQFQTQSVDDALRDIVLHGNNVVG